MIRTKIKMRFHEAWNLSTRPRDSKTAYFLSPPASSILFQSFQDVSCDTDRVSLWHFACRLQKKSTPARSRDC